MTKEEQRKALFELRSALVGKLHTQPFTIFQDSVVDALVAAQPKTLTELARVKGFPKNGKRITGFGESIIAIFNAKPGDKVGFNVKVTKGSCSICAELKSLQVF